MKRIAAAAAFLLLVGVTAPAQAATLRPIDQDGLNLRAGPGTDFAVVGGLAPDQAAAVLGKEGDWYRIRLSSGTEGWVAGWFSRILLDDEQRYAVVNTDVLNVRREANLSAPVLTRLVQDQYVRLLEMIPEWWRVRLDDGTEGWVAAEYMVRATTPPPTTPPATPPVTPPATPPGTPPATPPGTPPATPPATPPGIPATAPPAPVGTVPVLAIKPPLALTVLPGKRVQVKVETGVYAGPNSEARRVDTVRPGESLHLLDAGSGWVRTETPRGKRGWIHGSLVQVLDGRLKLALAELAWALEALSATPQPPAVPVLAADTPFRTVKDADGLNLRLIPSMTARVLVTLPQGEMLEVLQKDGVWLRVQTADGLTGWVHGDYTLPFGEPAEPPAPAPAPAPNPAPTPTPVVTGEAFKVSMEQPFPGASRLVVQTEGKAVGQPVLVGSSLVIPFETGETVERAIPLNVLGVKQATITQAGLRLDLVGQPALQVEETATGKVSVLLRPVLQAITTEMVDGKAVYRFNLTGHAQPAAREAGENIIVEIPGAVLAGPIPQNGLRVVEHETGLRIAIPSYRAFSMKRSEQGFYLVVYPPGLAGKAILLDPGHGGDDGGAVSRLLGVVEKEVNLQVSLRLRALLESRGAKVFMTRAADRRAAPEEFLSSAAEEPRDQMDMLYRTTMANELKVDLFLSIHHNSGEPGLRGTETFYSSSTLNGERSRVAARLIQDELINTLGTINRGAKDDTYFVTRNTEAPAALVEVAFVNDPGEGPRTRDAAFQEAVAQAIVRALEQLYAERR